MDPQIMDVVKLALMYHLMRFIAGGIKPPSAVTFFRMEDRANFSRCYQGDMVTMQTIGVIINRFTGEHSEISRQFERNNPELVEEAIQKICEAQEFRDFFSWLVDTRSKDGFPECKRRAEECGLYISSSPGKDQIQKESKGLGDVKISDDNEINRENNSAGCLIPLALIGSSFLATVYVFLSFVV